MNKLIYFFGEGGKADRALLGGKGANLNEMTHMGIPVPPGFTITTEVCNQYLQNRRGYGSAPAVGETDETRRGGKSSAPTMGSITGKNESRRRGSISAPHPWPQGLHEAVQTNLHRLEEATKKGFGDPKNPLLVSVRSGAAVSMPGMMETVLNLGLNDETVQGLAERTKDARFAWDAYRRFIQMFASVVLNLDHDHFEEALHKAKEVTGARVDHELPASALQELVKTYQTLVQGATNKPFPQDVQEQLTLAINAVFNSWNIPRAVSYRTIHKIPHDLGTAVNIQAMVFGNRGEQSGTGVAFTRNPATGEHRFYGEYLINAQGEDVVAGLRTPDPIEQLQSKIPVAYAELERICDTLERHFGDMQDIEFTIEEGRLYMLQTRGGKRTAQAAVNIAVEMVKEGLIDIRTAIRRVRPGEIDQLLHPMIVQGHGKPVIATGLPASPGAASGKVVFDSRDAFEGAKNGEKVILVRKETSPDDIEGMHAAEGILTATGGMTSHAAVVARGMNKCCIVGCTQIVVNPKAKKFVTADGHEIYEGDIITLNGSTGEVILGAAPMESARMNEHVQTLLGWADDYACLTVRANADTPTDSQVARSFGAKGIGLCRTEHMFFGQGRIPAMQEMILAKDRTARIRALGTLETMQMNDFYELFKAMDGFPVTIRLLDPPLHEFLPHKKEDIKALAQKAGITHEHLRDIIESLKEVNPMLGHRGCRLMVTYPEITEMQTRAIINAAIKATKEGIKAHPEIMIPLVGTVEEYQLVAADIRRVADTILEKSDMAKSSKLKAQSFYKVGTMIEIPRACLQAESIAVEAEFFSFGTNDLTQMTYGYSRDDINKFLNEYETKGILKNDPFMTIDQKGVGRLVKMTIEDGRHAKPTLKIGVCGEHGGDPASIAFFHGVGLDYVSCSPYRVPIARLACAQAAIA